MSERIDTAELVDIRDVHVDSALPKQERIAEYLRQIKDPYHFKCGPFTITARFTEDGPTLEECLRRLMT
ncbi:MAG: hypothetical protein LBK56_07150 [Gracilibacteraceae bacterium]|jgi:hypothetical protein|nr:hypothetical protein [Gracilibacteraceae bacterium]